MYTLDLLADPLDVLTTTRRVVERARDVRIDTDAVARFAADIAPEIATPTGWDDLHLRDGTWLTAAFVFVLDALNFCFWSTSPDPADRWRVEWRGETHDGYWALVASLRRAVEEGRPLFDPGYLLGLTTRDVAHLLRPAEEDGLEIPLLPMRLANLHELGRGLRAIQAETADAVPPIVSLIERCDESAVRLVSEVVQRFPSFNDATQYDGAEVRLYKRAQILVADLHGAFGGTGLGAFSDLGMLTAFADYKVPQVLRELGILVYSDALSATIERRELLPQGAPAEVEIRAATIWACELLRRALAAAGRLLRATEVDWALWLAGQSLPAGARPYHRTYTVFY
jgi:hypothetical protein